MRDGFEMAYPADGFDSSPDLPESTPDPVADILAALREDQSALAAEIATAIEAVGQDADDATRAMAVTHVLMMHREALETMLQGAHLAAALEGMRRMLDAVPASPEATSAAAVAAASAVTAPPQQGVTTPDNLTGRRTLPLVEEAARYLVQGGLVPASQVEQAGADARDAARTIADNALRDTHAVVNRALVEAVRTGGTKEEFAATVRRQLADHGDSYLSDSAIENRFRTGVMSAYSAGQMRLVEGNPFARALFPYAAFHATHDDRVRHDHLGLETAGLDGTNVYRLDDPTFQKYRPPIFFQCRCVWSPVSVEGAAKLGVKEAQEWLRTGTPPTSPQWVAPPKEPPVTFAEAGYTLATDGFTMAGEFREEDHPRDHGKFAEKAGGKGESHNNADAAYAVLRKYVADPGRLDDKEAKQLAAFVRGSTTKKKRLLRISKDNHRHREGDIIDFGSVASFTGAVDEVMAGKSAGHIGWKSSDRVLYLIESPRRGHDVDYKAVGNVQFDASEENETLLAGRYRVKEVRQAVEPGTFEAYDYRVPLYVLEEVPEVEGYTLAADGFEVVAADGFEMAWVADQNYKGTRGGKWIGTGDDAGKRPRYQKAMPGTRGKKQPTPAGDKKPRAPRKSVPPAQILAELEPHGTDVAKLAGALAKHTYASLQGLAKHLAQKANGKTADLAARLLAKLEERAKQKQPEEKKPATKKEPWQMTLKEYQTNGPPNFGDMVSAGGVVGFLRGSNGARVKIVDRAGKQLAYADRDEVKLIRRMADQTADRGMGDTNAAEANVRSLDPEFKRKQAADLQALEDEYASDKRTPRQLRTPAQERRLEEYEAKKQEIRERQFEWTPEKDATGHKAAVKAALAAGKPVPPEVLADYPDLAQKPAPQQAEKKTPETRSLVDTNATPMEQARQAAAAYNRKGHPDDLKDGWPAVISPTQGYSGARLYKQEYAKPLPDQRKARSILENAGKFDRKKGTPRIGDLARALADGMGVSLTDAYRQIIQWHRDDVLTLQLQSNTGADAENAAAGLAAEAGTYGYFQVN